MNSVLLADIQSRHPIVSCFSNILLFTKANKGKVNHSAMTPPKYARKSIKTMLITAEHTARKMLNNINERIKKARSSKEIIKNMSLTPLIMNSSRE